MRKPTLSRVHSYEIVETFASRIAGRDSSLGWPDALALAVDALQSVDWTRRAVARRRILSAKREAC